MPIYTLTPVARGAWVNTPGDEAISIAPVEQDSLRCWGFTMTNDKCRAGLQAGTRARRRSWHPV
jgi:hypothetical protein